jgi:hypothetical protein
MAAEQLQFGTDDPFAGQKRDNLVPEQVRVERVAFSTSLNSFPLIE